MPGGAHLAQQVAQPLALGDGTRSSRWEELLAWFLSSKGEGYGDGFAQSLSLVSRIISIPWKINETDLSH